MRKFSWEGEDFIENLGRMEEEVLGPAEEESGVEYALGPPEKNAQHPKRTHLSAISIGEVDADLWVEEYPTSLEHCRAESPADYDSEFYFDDFGDDFDPEDRSTDTILLIMNSEEDVDQGYSSFGDSMTDRIDADLRMYSEGDPSFYGWAFDVTG